MFIFLNRCAAILFYSRLCPSTAGSSPPQESSIFLCPLLSSSIPLLVAPQYHLSNDVLVFRLILHPLCLPLCASNSPSIIFHLGDVSSPFPCRIGCVLDNVCHSGSLPNGGVTNAQMRCTLTKCADKDLHEVPKNLYQSHENHMMLMANCHFADRFDHQRTP